MKGFGIGAEIVKIGDEFFADGSHGVYGNNFFVDELLDFSNDFEQEEEPQQPGGIGGQETTYVFCFVAGTAVAAGIRGK